MKQIESELETLQEKLHKIKTWIDAYPLEVFPEPDFKKAHEVLRQHDISLDAISASNMRHVLNGIKDIIEGKDIDLVRIEKVEET